MYTPADCSVLHHFGLWVAADDAVAALEFFDRLLDFSTVSRAKRKGGGERLLLRNPPGQIIELLVADTVQYLDHYPRHPTDKMAGIAHFCFEVDDLLRVRAIADELQCEIIRQAPDDGGYGKSELGEHRILFIQSPMGVTIELFEFRHKHEF